MAKNNLQTLKDVVKSMQNGKIQPVIFLKGDDYFLQNYMVKRLEKSIFGDEQPDRELLIPEDMSQKEILIKLTQPDLFSSKKLFILRNPQKILQKYREELLTFCKKPVPNHYLVIIMDDFYNKLAIVKSLEKLFKPVDTRSPFHNTLKSWAEHFFKENNIDAPPSVVQTVLEIAGDSVYHIANQIDQICLRLDDEADLTPEFVLMFGGWKKEFRAWEFYNAVGDRDLAKALIIGNELLSRSELITFMPALTSLFQELLYIKMEKGTSAFFRGYSPLSQGVRSKLPSHAKKYSHTEIESALSLLGQIDMSIKTSNESDTSRLTRFLFTSCDTHG